MEVGNVDSIPKGEEADLPGERVKKVDSSDERAEGNEDNLPGGKALTHLVKQWMVRRLVHLMKGSDVGRLTHLVKRRKMGRLVKGVRE